MAKLVKRFTERCQRCKHGRAAHGTVDPGLTPCKMKHCKCKGLVVSNFEK